MKIKLHNLLTTLVLIQLVACKENEGFPPYLTTITVRVTEEDGHKPIPGTHVKILFQHPNPELIFKHTGESYFDGTYSAQNKSLGNFDVDLRKDGYYPVTLKEIVALNPDRSAKRVASKEFIMRKIINPIPLYAKQNDIPIPENDKWIGFDLEIVDWVNPYGNGIVSDVEFQLTNKFVSLNYREENSLTNIQKILESEHENGYNKKEFFKTPAQFYNRPINKFNYENTIPFYFGKWQGTLKMRVPHEKGGIVIEKDRYLAYSTQPQSDYPNQPAPEMRMPHRAPGEGYMGEYKWEKTTSNDSIFDKKLGFFIKTRVKFDEQGNVISAHYAKFITDVQIDIRGRIKFTSYFNPTPNDTNLEFDLKKNLFPDLKGNEKPFLP